MGWVAGLGGGAGWPHVHGPHFVVRVLQQRVRAVRQAQILRAFKSNDIVWNDIFRTAADTLYIVI